MDCGPPAALLAYTALRELELSNCHLHVLPEFIGGLTQLTKLSLTSDSMTEVPSCVLKLCLPPSLPPSLGGAIIAIIAISGYAISGWTLSCWPMFDISITQVTLSCKLLQEPPHHHSSGLCCQNKIVLLGVTVYQNCDQYTKHYDINTTPNIDNTIRDMAEN